MNNITQITRRDIFDLFKNGYKEYDAFAEYKDVFYPYYGHLTVIDFLKKLYSLDLILSSDDRFEKAEQDIKQQTIKNNDWDPNRIFSENRFRLLEGSDSELLDFLCAVFAPENRNERLAWRNYLKKINAFLKADGYELYESDKISQRSVYSYRKLTKEEIINERFIPFSVRNMKEIKSKALKIKNIPDKLKFEFLQLFNKYNEEINERTETGYNYNVRVKDAVFRDIKGFYIPSFFENKKYFKTDSFDDFIRYNYPYKVFDAIELFSQYCKNRFVDEINLILESYQFTYKLVGGKIELDHQIKIKNDEVIMEPGLKGLVKQSIEQYNRGTKEDKRLAVNTIWDAFERLKTYYTYLDKKNSSEKIINDISNKNKNYKELFDDEFKKLTKIGNEFCIRHYETNRVDIIDSNYYDYFFHRCYALINLSLMYLEKPVK